MPDSINMRSFTNREDIERYTGEALDEANYMSPNSDNNNLVNNRIISAIRVLRSTLPFRSEYNGNYEPIILREGYSQQKSWCGSKNLLCFLFGAATTIVVIGTPLIIKYLISASNVDTIGPQVNTNNEMPTFPFGGSNRWNGSESSAYNGNNGNNGNVFNPWGG